MFTIAMILETPAVALFMVLCMLMKFLSKQEDLRQILNFVGTCDQKRHLVRMSNNDGILDMMSSLPRPCVRSRLGMNIQLKNVDILIL